MEVVEVTPIGVAAKSGMRVGDLVVAINDRITSSVDDVHCILALLPRETLLDATLLRERSRLEVRVDWAS